MAGCAWLVSAAGTISTRPRRPPRAALVALGIAAIAVIAIAALAAAGAPRRTLGLVALAMAVVPCTGYLAAFIRPAVLLSGAMFLTMFAGNWRSVGLPHFVSPDRFLFIAAIAAFLLRDPATGERRPLRPTWTHFVLALAAAYVIASGLAVGTLFQRANLYPFVDRFGLVPFILFAVAPAVFVTDRDRRLLLGVFVAMGAYLAFVAMAQGIGANSLVWPRYILNTNVGAHQSGRARGPFADSAVNGIALYVSAVACAVAFVTWRSTGWRRVAVIIAAVCLFDEIWTLERSVWIGATAATLITMLVVPRLRKYVPVSLTLGAIAVIGALLLVPGLSGQVHNRLRNQLTVWDRANLNGAAERMFLARPLTGFGWGTYATRSIDYFKQAPNFPLTNTGLVVHNVVLSNLAELGLLGTGLWALGLLMGVGGAILLRGPPELVPWRAGLLAVFVMWLVVANLTPLLSPYPNDVLWLWAGVAWPLRA